MTSDLRQRFGARIREAREALTATGTSADQIRITCRGREEGDPPLSQEQVAKVVGLRQPAVSAWENGTAFPEPETLFGLLRFLRISLGDVMAVSDESEAAVG